MFDNTRSIARLENAQDYDNGVENGPGVGSLVSSFSMIPGLRGLWLPGMMDEVGDLYDQSGQSRKLSHTGSNSMAEVIVGSQYMVAQQVYAGTSWHSRAHEAGMNCLGTETQVAAAVRGMTCGGWFQFAVGSAPSSTTYELISKNAAGSNRGPRLFCNGASGLTFNVSNTGSAVSDQIAAAASSPGNPVLENTWYYVVGRFITQDSISICVNGTITKTASATSSLFACTSPFAIGVLGNLVSNPLKGSWAAAFWAAAIMSDQMIQHIFNQTRALFNV